LRGVRKSQDSAGSIYSSQCSMNMKSAKESIFAPFTPTIANVPDLFAHIPSQVSQFSILVLSNAIPNASLFRPFVSIHFSPEMKPNSRPLTQNTSTQRQDSHHKARNNHLPSSTRIRSRRRRSRRRYAGAGRCDNRSDRCESWTSRRGKDASL
jgi:hypothetical protein